jgi:hypothetical protein
LIFGPPGAAASQNLEWTNKVAITGGIRVIYCWKVSDDEIWLLTVYGKSERETIPAHILKQIAEEIKDV